MPNSFIQQKQELFWEGKSVKPILVSPFIDGSLYDQEELLKKNGVKILKSCTFDLDGIRDYLFVAKKSEKHVAVIDTYSVFGTGDIPDHTLYIYNNGRPYAFLATVGGKAILQFREGYELADKILSTARMTWEQRKILKAREYKEAYDLNQSDSEKLP